LIVSVHACSLFLFFLKSIFRFPDLTIRSQDCFRCNGASVAILKLCPVTGSRFSLKHKLLGDDLKFFVFRYCDCDILLNFVIVISFCKGRIFARLGARYSEDPGIFLLLLLQITFANLILPFQFPSVQ